MELSGKIIAILPQRSGTSKTGNTWESQDFVIETSGEYPKKMCFNVWGAEKLDLFNIQQGEELTVSFDIDCREWNGKWFNDIRAWKIDRAGNSAPQAVNAPYVASSAPAPKNTQTKVEPAQQEDNDLPF